MITSRQSVTFAKKAVNILRSGDPSGTFPFPVTYRPSLTISTAPFMATLFGLLTPAMLAPCWGSDTPDSL